MFGRVIVKDKNGDLEKIEFNSDGTIAKSEPVIKNEPRHGDKVLEAENKRPGEISVENFINFDATISKQAILALRFLAHSGR